MRVNKFNKVSGYKISIQKSVLFLHTSSEQSKNEFKKTTSFRIATKRINYLEINITKEVQDMCTENYKTLLKEMKE